MIKSNDDQHNNNNNNNNNNYNNDSYTLLECFSMKDLKDFFPRQALLSWKACFSCMLSLLRSKYFSVLANMPWIIFRT